MIIKILTILALLIGVVVFQGIYIIYSHSTTKTKIRNEDTNTNLYVRPHTGSHIDTNLQDKIVINQGDTITNIPEPEKDHNLQPFTDYEGPLPTEIPAMREESPVYAIKDYWNESNKTRPIIYIVNFGRMGNRLFHYAVTYCTALQTHRTPTIPRESYLFTLFPDLSAKRVNITYLPKINMDQLDQRLRIGETGWSRYTTNIHERVNKYNNTWLKGCFQSWRYFVGCEKSLRREFTFSSDLQERVNKQMQEFAADYMNRNNIVVYDITFIGIHARLGDMLLDKQMLTGYTHAPASYFRKAMSYYNHKYRWPVYIAASEDIQWCKDNIESPQNNVYFSNYTHRDYMLDFIMLSSCNHSIITVGSYGWFTAWMANGEVVYYDQFPVPGSNLSKGFNFTDKYPLTWIGMS